MLLQAFLVVSEIREKVYYERNLQLSKNEVNDVPHKEQSAEKNCLKGFKIGSKLQSIGAEVGGGDGSRKALKVPKSMSIA